MWLAFAVMGEKLEGGGRVMQGSKHRIYLIPRGTHRPRGTPGPLSCAPTPRFPRPSRRWFCGARLRLSRLGATCTPYPDAVFRFEVEGPPEKYASRLCDGGVGRRWMVMRMEARGAPCAAGVCRVWHTEQ